MGSRARRWAAVAAAGGTVALGSMVVGVTAAYAWHGDLTGSGACNADGHAIITAQLAVSNDHAHFTISDGRRHARSGNTGNKLTVTRTFDEGPTGGPLTVILTAIERWKGGITSGPQTFPVTVSAGCVTPPPPTTTTVPPTTTTVAPSTTTTVEAATTTTVVIPSTTVPHQTTTTVRTPGPTTTVAPSTTTTTKPTSATTRPAGVPAGPQVPAPHSVTPHGNSGLAFTGADVAYGAGAAGVALAAGSGLVLISRRRNNGY